MNNLTTYLSNKYLRTCLRLAAVVLIMALCYICSGLTVHAADIPTASAQINSDGGVNLRSSATTGSKVVKVIADNAKITIISEVFTKKGSTKASDRWYQITSSGKAGYVRADLVDNIKYSLVKGTTTDALNYRVGAGTDMSKKGTLKNGAEVTVVLKAQPYNSKDTWYKIKQGSGYYFVTSEFVTFSGAVKLPETTAPVNTEGKSDAAKALLEKATTGGSARNVYTFSTSNCKKVFSVTGYNKVNTPQGLTFTGSEYYILYGNKQGQRIVTYSKDGKRVSAANFNKNIGHPNGITWDPVTKLCYIFKGNQYTIYTWDPATNKFGTSKTPYSSSGIGYDAANKLLYASSKTGIRVYSADGKFTHYKLFSRCTHSGTTYIQDCCAYNGLVFHGISGAKKAKENYIDVYRVSDGQYLGSIIESIGEIESFIVDNDGYLQMLVNTSGNTDYIWKTPLNVNELIG